MSEIKFNTSGNLITLNINLWSRRTQRFENMLITFDTGASTTVISKDILYVLGYEFENPDKAKIITASGVEFVDSVILDKVNIGGHILENVEVYAHTFPEASFALGVLGLNVMKCFDINILFSKGIIELIPLEEY
ncbi:MAG: retroviral-like aspartic protease family protein [Cellulosilyticaceae bacterium]